MYMWIIALNVVIFENYKINYRLIMSIDKLDSGPAYFLTYSSFFTFVYMMVFLIYIMRISLIIHVGSLEAASYLPLTVLGSQIIYTAMPLPIFNWRARWLFIRRIFETVLSPILECHFYSIWIIEQLISCIELFEDFVYTICSYATLDFSTATA